MGASPFFNLQDVHAAQGTPTDPTGDAVQFDQEPTGAMPPMGAAPPPEIAPFQPMGTPQMPMGPATNPGPPMAPPASPMGPVGPIATPPPTGDLTANVPDMQTRLQQYMDMSRRVYEPMKRAEYSPEELRERPNIVGRILANVATFGLQEHAWSQRDAARSWYNAQAREHNAAIESKSLESARDMLKADMDAQMAQQRFGMEQMRFNQNALQQQNSFLQRELDRQMRQQKEARLARRDEFSFPSEGGDDFGTPGAPAEPEGDYAGPAPGSPLAAGGAPPATTPAAPGSQAPNAAMAAERARKQARLPGESPFSWRERLKAQSAEEVQAGKTRATETAKRAQSTRSLRQLLDDPLTDQMDKFLISSNDAYTDFPLETTLRGAAREAGPAGVARGLQTGDPAAMHFQMVETQVSNLARALGQVGVLTDRDVRLVMPLVQFRGASKEQFRAGREALKRLLERQAQGDTSWMKPGQESPLEVEPEAPVDPGDAPQTVDDILNKYGY